MKKYILSALALSALFVACSNEEVTSPAAENSLVSFVLDKQVSRTVTSGNTTTFVTGDAIGITSSGLDIDMSNSTYTVGADGNIETLVSDPTQKEKFEVGKEVTVIKN